MAKSSMAKSATARAGSQQSAQKIHAILLLILGLCFVALGLRTYPAFIAVGGLFVLVAYRGYTATFQTPEPPNSDTN